MQFNRDTIEVLKNFGTINQNLKFKKGKVLRTMSESGNIFSEATIPDEIPADFCVYEISQFLGALSMFEDAPELSFNGSYVDIKSPDGKNNMKFVYAAEEAITAPPDTDPKFDDPIIEFELTDKQITQLERSAGVMKVQSLTIKGEDGKVKVVVHDRDNPSSSAFEIDTGTETEDEFNFDTTVSALTLLTGDYNVSLSLTGKLKVAVFKHKTFPVKYMIGGNKTSTYTPA